MSPDLFPGILITLLSVLRICPNFVVSQMTGWERGYAVWIAFEFL